MSDWGVTHDAVNSAEAGLDIEMQGGLDDEFHKLIDLVMNGKVPEDTVDGMAGHVFAAMYTGRSLLRGLPRLQPAQDEAQGNQRVCHRAYHHQ